MKRKFEYNNITLKKMHTNTFSFTIFFYEFLDFEIVT